MTARDDGLITPEAIPFVDTDPSLIATAALDLAGAGRGIAAGGSAVSTAWSSLGSSYEAPEAGQLLTVMAPVEEATERVGLTMLKAGRILQDFAEDLAAPRRRLRELRTEAEAFVASVSCGITVDITSADHPAFDASIFSFMVTDFGDMGPATIPWDKHQPSIERNFELLSAVNTQVALVDEARAKCVNALRGLVNDRVCAPVEVALTAHQLDQEGVELPWGTATVGDRSCYENVGDGIEMSFIETLDSVGALMAIDTYGESFEDAFFQWDLAGGAWSQLAQSLGAVLFSVAVGPQTSLFRASGNAPQWLKDADDWASGRNRQLIGGLIGSVEEWEDNPARASGALGFNALTGLLGGGGGAAVKFGSRGSLFDDLNGGDPELARRVEPLPVEEQLAIARTQLSIGSLGFANNDAAHLYGRTGWTDYADALPSSEKRSLRLYSLWPPYFPTYRHINGELRSGAPLSDRVSAAVKNIDSALAGRPLPDTIVVERGTNLTHILEDPEDMVGHIYDEPGFMSTSLGTAAFDDLAAVLHLRVPAGTPALYMERVSALGSSERELLLARGLRYRVRNTVFDGTKWQIFGEVLR